MVCMPAPLHLETLWRYTNAVIINYYYYVIIIIIINAKLSCPIVVESSAT